MWFTVTLRKYLPRFLDYASCAYPLLQHRHTCILLYMSKFAPRCCVPPDMSCTYTKQCTYSCVTTITFTCVCIYTYHTQHIW